MSAASARFEVRWVTTRSALAGLLFALYPLARCIAAGLGLAHWLGTGWAALTVLLVVCLRWTLLLQAGAWLTLVSLWHWPWLAAAVVVAPRLLTVLPGLITTWLATVRHPRPRWQPWTETPAARGVEHAPVRPVS